MSRLVFAIRGDTAAARAVSLDRALARWREAGGEWTEGPQGEGLALFVIVTDPRRETSVEHSLSYARGEIADGIGEAGGSI